MGQKEVALMPESYEEWAVAEGLMEPVVRLDPLECPICLFTDDVLKQIDIAWSDFGARETELDNYLTYIGVTPPPFSIYYLHFTDINHRRI